MVKVRSCQFNYSYRNRVFFPYSVAMLIGYIKSIKELNQNFDFDKAFVLREKVDEYVQKCTDTEILLCSCYVWNWEITNYFANEVRKINPNCLIIFGGPHVPNRSEGFFEKHPYVDILVHGEGEYVLANLFKAFLKNKNYFDVKGIETKEFRNEPEPRINDLDTIPSVYLTNLMWDVVDKDDDIVWQVSWETNRGCPYSCTFCDWGSATNTKMRKFSDDRLFKEIEWFADNKILFIYCCDANFGIYQKRDLALATKMKEESIKKGYPEQFRMAWAKFSSDKIIPIAKQLQANGLLNAITLAVQSLDELTLDIIKRANIKFDKFSELTDTFLANNIPTYSEIIMGLPGETLDSFKHGLQTLADDTKLDAIYIYNCGVLPNAPMNEPSYVEHHKIKTVRSPIYLAHSDVHNRQMPEYEYITTSAASFTEDEFKEMHHYAWLFQTFHSFGILESVSKFYKKTHGLSTIEFFETLLTFCKTNESFISEEYQKVVDYTDAGCNGKGWDHHDPNLGEIYWPIEEATWLRLVMNKQRLLDSITSFLTYLENQFGYNNSKMLIRDLAKFQVFLLTTRDDIENTKSENFEFNWKNFFATDAILENIPKNYYYKNLIVEKDSVQWCWQTIWFGRLQKKYKFHPEKLNEENTLESISETILKCPKESQFS